MDRKTLVGLLVVTGIARGQAPLLDRAWTASVGGQSIQVNDDGSFTVSNISSPDSFGPTGPGSPPDFLSDDAVRVIGTACIDGQTWWAFSEPFQIVNGETFLVGDLTITQTPPLVPVALTVVAGFSVLEPGQTTQVTTTASLADDSKLDVTDHTAWTTYRTSNPAVVTVDQDGFVMAHGLGVAFVTATNGGATAVERLDVLSQTVETTVEGFVQFADGLPATNAQISTNYGGFTTTDLTGFFSLIVQQVPSDGQLDVDVSLEHFAAHAHGVPVVPDGIADAGVLTLIEFSAGPWFPHQLLRTGFGPIAVIGADFDQNGAPDLAVANFSTDDVSVFLGEMNGTFSESRNTGVGNGPIALAIGEFDQDPNIDLAVANRDSNTVSILLGDGSGMFRSSEGLPVGNLPIALASDDFNADTYADLVIVNSGSDDVVILLGDGLGGFSNFVSYNVGQGPIAIATGEFNGDRAGDLIVLNRQSHSYTVLIGHGDGTFGLSNEILVGEYPHSVAVGRFDQDMFLDLAIASTGSDDITILLGQGDGTFDISLVIPVGLNPQFLRTGDFDLDGNEDLAVARAGGDDVRVFLGNGEGVFGEVGSIQVGDTPTSIEAKDFDGDKKRDLAVTNRFSHNVSILFGAGDGTFETSSQILNLGDFVASADFSGDQNHDVVIADSGCSEVATILGDGEGGFANAQVFDVSTNPERVYPADFDNDNNQDLAIGVNFGGAALSLYLGLGNGSFSSEIVVIGSGAGGCRALVAGDFDKDGNEDVAAGLENNPIHVLLGNGDGSFTTSQILSAGCRPVGIVRVDLNSDGYEDLVTANELSNDVSVFLSNGEGAKGTFQQGLSYPAGNLPQAIAAADLDGDSVQDIVVANNFSDDVSLLFGVGDGTLEATKSLAVGNRARFVRVVDVDVDGIPDLVVSAYFGSRAELLVFKGNGDRTFEQARSFFAGSSPRSIAVADFDDDGDADLAIAGGATLTLLNQRIR